MNDYADYLRRHRRLSILRTLEMAPGYQSNESMITQVLNKLAIATTRDQVRTELVWLGEQGYVTTEEVAGLLIAEATLAGQEIALGRRVHPDIEKPSPRKK